jgi:2-phospho-L-lactate guanylyltransferase (CobY/MobA/RfbA family)
MTDSAEAATIATARGATVLRDPAGADLATRIESAARTLAARGARRLLLLASDLPRVSRAAIEEFIETAAGAEAVVSARRDDGVNALISELPWPSGLTLGPGSASASAARLSAAGRRCVKLSSGPLCEDLDVPADLARIAI